MIQIKTLYMFYIFFKLKYWTVLIFLMEFKSKKIFLGINTITVRGKFDEYNKVYSKIFKLDLNMQIISFTTCSSTWPIGTILNTELHDLNF